MPDSLHEAVARAIADNCWRVVDASDGHPSLVEDPDRAAAVAIRVVLAEAQRSLEALPRFEGGGLLRSNGAWVSRREALAVLAMLVPPPLV